MKKIVELADTLLKLYENQREYFNSIVDFLKEYKKVYALTTAAPDDSIAACAAAWLAYTPEFSAIKYLAICAP